MTRKVTVTCSRCGREWPVDLDRLDEIKREVYRDGDELRPQGKQYRVSCTQCSLRQIITVAE